MNNQMGPPEGGGNCEPEYFNNPGQDKAGTPNRVPNGPTVGTCPPASVTNHRDEDQ